ncbi:nucleotidyltransferase family protein [Saprospiraceae bacterium]|nr:nucleotidyltransferase family protein [Saprospiraceae bacterium]
MADLEVKVAATKAVESFNSQYLVLLLAAGESRRLGEPKQLLPVGKQTLLEHTFLVCTKSKLGPVHVVLGANADKILEAASKQLSSNIMIHRNWKDGLGSSIAFGVKNTKHLVEKGILVVLVDQVMLKAENLVNLVIEYEDTKAEIIVSDYGNANGPPSFFARSLFDQLIELSGDQGAKPIVKANKHLVHKVSFPMGDIDIDQHDDLLHLNKIKPS